MKFSRCVNRGEELVSSARTLVSHPGNGIKIGETIRFSADYGRAQTPRKGCKLLQTSPGSQPL
ncbi:hypothetical protein [Roseimaritima multifibrata]|uniref:hypothetical protein n=1 Tax=Roseimaritima multifibrata TaxID=1930274 RepID=UPI0011AA92B8|nr:hypothetical protein [Roseimaritima multifibrata]